MSEVRAERMLIEAAVPTFDAMIAEHVVVAADPPTTFQAARTLDLLTVRTPLLVASMWIRGLPEQLLGKATPTPPRLVLAEGFGLPGWLSLGDYPTREIAFGAVGKFWRPAIEWRDVAPADFDRLAEPGWGRSQPTSRCRPMGKSNATQLRMPNLRNRCRLTPSFHALLVDHPAFRRAYHARHAEIDQSQRGGGGERREQVMRVLASFGSKRGGTAGLAAMIGDALTEAGCDVAVSPAKDAGDVAGVDAVIVAGALYANGWHRHARRFVRRNASALRELPVWLVSSGPLDGSAEERDIPPTAQVAKLASRVGARGHVTIGGRLEPDAKGFPASAMAKTRAGDWRSPAHVRRWVTSVVAELHRSKTTHQT
ncbi:flavodoxin domain-containing protein [Mycobacterium sp.]|uniref:flavodoxin domain-containing protein n=1 Tax=Mycobacterium sp. TaxID=1785 RepID=UPI003F98F79D